MRTDVAPSLSVALLQTWPGRVADALASTPKTLDSNVEDQNARRREAAEKRTKDSIPMSGLLRIERDEASGLYVQTLFDPITNEVLRQFPHESRLAFARAARAYVDAQMARR